MTRRYAWPVCYPDRFAGLTVFAPQDVHGAIAEIERGMRSLGLSGAVINSHFRPGDLRHGLPLSAVR